MDDRRQSFAYSSTDFFFNLFGVYLNTSSSANDHMQYMHPTHFYNEVGSSSATMQMNTISPQINLMMNHNHNNHNHHCATHHVTDVVATVEPITIMETNIFSCH